MIRIADTSEIPALHTLVERAFRGEAARKGWTHEADLLDGQRTDQAALAAVMRDKTQTILLFTENESLVGCIQVGVQQGRAHLAMLSVAPERQGQGVGDSLLLAAEAHAMGAGASLVEMTVIEQRSELVNYYERRGYRLTGETRPFPSHNPRFGLPKIPNLRFVVLRKQLDRSE